MNKINTIKDLYPSRGKNKAGLLTRKDPVIYASDYSGSPLSKEEINEYEENGFLILKGVFDKEEVQKFKNEIDNLKNDSIVKSSDFSITEPDHDEVRSVFKVHEISQVFKNLATNDRLKKIARYILDDQVYIHQSRINYKPGFKGKEFYWHSDFETWHVEDGMPRMRALSISIALTDNYTFNGSLMLIPGSHKEYVVCEGETPENHFKKSLKKQEYGVPSQEYLSLMAQKGGIFTATGNAGDVIMFDCNTIHGSNGNISPFPRSNIFFVYNAILNKVGDPYCNQPPRPEYICSREHIEVI